jgi:hypothetical protein
MNIHENLKPYKCEYCNSSFAHPSTLKIHIRAHTGDKPFRCCHCEYAAAQISNLKSHIKLNHTNDAQQRRKKEETRVQKAFSSADVEYIREHRIELGCIGGTYARLDFIFVGKCIVILEVDEDQHSAYQCDLRRMMNIAAAIRLDSTTQPILFVRYNPHSFKVDEKVVKVLKANREKRLVEYIQTALVTEQTYSIACQYMYYDMTQNKLSLWKETDYSSEFKALCLPPVYQ